MLVVDIFLIVLPVLGFILIFSDKYDPFKAITNCAVIVLLKMLVAIFGWILILGVLEMPGDIWREYFFGKETMAIIPAVVFFAAICFIIAAKFSSFNGKLIRAVLSTIGSGLAIFGLIYYAVLGNGNAAVMTIGKESWLGMFGLVLAMVNFCGIVAYSFLPQTREF